MILTKKLINRIKFITRHDYANPNARLEITRSESNSILKHLEAYKELLILMRSKNSKLDPIWMQQYATHMLQFLENISPVIPKKKGK